MDAYGIFQGGGAKGYAHVGALKAAEQRDIRFIRIAGTSAGAIIATLAAAGYTADELLDPTRPLGERGILDVDVAEVLDAEQYAAVTNLEESFRSLCTIKTPRAGLIGRWQRAKREWKPLLVARGLKLLALQAGMRVQLRRNFGAVDTEPLVGWLDNRLREKIGGAGPVTFGDLAMRLRMVAANLRTGRIERFGFPGDENLAVAPATIASACYPFFFRPVISGADMFVDGGLLSNLPVWLFDDERDDDTSHLPTFGFRLINDALVPKDQVAPTRFFSYAQRILQTLSSGGRDLEERRIDYYHGIDLPARIGMLSFKEARAEAPRLVETARTSVEEYFRREVGPQDPEQMRRVLMLVVDLLSEHYGWRGERVRAHILLPEADGRHARTVYSCNMDSDADDHLRVRTDVDGVGAVFRLREPVYVVSRPGAVIAPGALKYEMKARPAEIGGLYSIPMFDDIEDWSRTVPLDRAQPFAALVIDRDGDLAPMVLDELEQDTLANVAAIVGEAIRDRTIVRSERSASGPSTVSGWDQALSGSSFRVALRKVRDAGDGSLGERLSEALGRLNRET